jgi:hypothetical protein
MKNKRKNYSNSITIAKRMVKEHLERLFPCNHGKIFDNLVTDEPDFVYPKIRLAYWENVYDRLPDLVR